MHGNLCISVCILSCIEFLIFIFLTQNHFRSSAMTISDPGHCILTASSDGTVRLLDTIHPRMRAAGQLGGGRAHHQVTGG